MSALVPVLETERLLLRGWTGADLEPLADMLADPAVMAYIGEGRALTEEEARVIFERRRGQWEARGFGFWALELREDPGRLVGWAGLQMPDWLPAVMPAVEAGWMLTRERWGHGYATEVGGQSLAFGFEELGLARIIALHHPDNRASEHVMEKLDMEPAGDLTDPRNGRPVRMRALTREAWARIRR